MDLHASRSFFSPAGELGSRPVHIMISAPYCIYGYWLIQPLRIHKDRQFQAIVDRTFVRNLLIILCYSRWKQPSSGTAKVADTTVAIADDSSDHRGCYDHLGIP